MKKILPVLIAATVVGAAALATLNTAEARWGYGAYRGVGYRGLAYRGYGYRGYGYRGYGYRGYGYRGGYSYGANYGYGSGNSYGANYGYGSGNSYGANYGYGGGYGYTGFYAGTPVPALVVAPAVYYVPVSYVPVYPTISYSYGYWPGCGC